ncbi:hypothetical protein IMX26_03585 [Clostridium sp. 'deep sea']|uniref:hypothetical protein n=1 Tax=Clostridium sp. 'deep sea' TaxID=2779445 RepID=UPI0018969513|nr:hypothetical protein [Clostridium sp. 'deep sea']QOR35912.1 hypothetical protein IMX26_03585 [Clostridium sp. 'deep sea']
MIKRNKGSIMIWVIVVLFTISLLLTAYAKIVFNDYNISLSIFRQHRALQNTYSGLEVAKDYFTVNANQLLNYYFTFNESESIELYPVGELISYTSLLSNYNIDKIYLIKNNNGELFICCKAHFAKATEELKLKVTYINNNIFGYIEQIK